MENGENGTDGMKLRAPLL